ncbi:sigma-54 interaction domain-containing protein [Bacillus sp. FJAT-42315]|uniref:sigma-54 interaction domain-containing protein n=1 Tax=Bacillus sp. FJAT-42315 TaxID=2014077 RepID=UPI000C236597|nr:sigma 54-interacting transcriptional regulator [Bacillus sp. FJAT-42315]
METIYSLAFLHSYDGICIFDKHGFGLEINKAAERITGFSREDFIGENIASAIEKGYISKSVTELILKNKRPHTEVISIRGVEMLVTGNPIFDSKGQIDYIVLNVRDISELKNVKIDLLLSIALKRKNNADPLFPHPETLPSVPIAGNIIASSPKTQHIVHLATKVAKVDSSVLILGESGVGKEVIVKLIHQQSLRAEYPLIKINCAAIPQHLLESELFGYEKGAFTGADQNGKTGLFEEANGGTIFLDEIGDMPIDLQVKLLRVLQEYEIRRVGGRKDIKINVRIISATNKNLEQLIKNGEFREDLYYRLNIVPLKIPPLRERVEDIKPLAHMILNQTNQKYNLHKHFQPGVIELFEKHSWPGNIREMENMIERLVVTSEQEEITWSDLPFIAEHPSLSGSYSLKHTLEEVEKKIILEKMQMYKTTRKVAKALGISQSAVVKKLQKYKLSF